MGEGGAFLKDKYYNIIATYSTVNEPLPLFTSRLDELEDIDNSFNLESFQLGMKGDEHTSTSNTITE